MQLQKKLNKEMNKGTSIKVNELNNTDIYHDITMIRDLDIKTTQL